jgi:uncharacterized protein YjbI with pentapeptide repeats
VLITKPSQCALITRPIEYRKRFGLCITSYLYLSYADSSEPALLGEQSLWKYVAGEMNPAMLDEGITKSVPEFLVHGSAYARDGAVSACAVRVRFASIDKTLLVFGPRYWHDGKPSAPELFESLPIAWANAFGAEGYPPNPVGKGLYATSGVHWLPNVESPNERIIRPDQKVVPAGFGMRDVMHPDRVSLRGNYDDSYLKEHSPGFTPDTDWKYFNLAPQDQWLPSPLLGNESFSIENMHPTKKIVAGVLPSFKVRAMVKYGIPNEEKKVSEVPMRLTTVWFFPHTESCVLAFQGLAEVSEDDASDVAELLLAVERLGEEKSDSHYLAVQEKRKHPSYGAIHALNDDDLLPANANLADPTASDAKKAFAMEGLQGQAQMRRAQADVLVARQNALAIGKDPDALGIKMPVKEPLPSNKELPAYLEKQKDLARKDAWKSVEQIVGVLENAMKFEKELGVKIADLAPRGPPLMNAPQEFAAMKTQLGQNSGINLASIYPKLLKKEAIDRMNYLQFAHHQPPAHSISGEVKEKLRSEMAVAIRKGIKHFAGVDFTGADFSNLDLRGINFAGAWMESVNFSGSNLSKANLSGAVIAHASFVGAIAIGANFNKANLGKVNFKNVVLDNATFNDSIFELATFDNASVRAASLVKSNLNCVQWKSADLTGAILTNQLFNKVDCKAIVFEESDLRSAIFIECDLGGVQFANANLGSATFHKSNLNSANLSGVVAPKSMFVAGTTLTGSKMKNADFTGSNFGGIHLESSELIGACFDQANLSTANFNRCDLRFSKAKGALCRRTQFRQAKLAGSNFMEAVLQHADLRGADFRKSNLFGADLSRIKLDANTLFDQSMLTRSRTYPRLSAEQQNSLR